MIKSQKNKECEEISMNKLLKQIISFIMIITLIMNIMNLEPDKTVYAASDIFAVGEDYVITYMPNNRGVYVYTEGKETFTYGYIGNILTLLEDGVPVVVRTYYFYLMSGKCSWFQAQRVAEAHGGHLITIDSDQVLYPRSERLNEVYYYEIYDHD